MGQMPKEIPSDRPSTPSASSALNLEGQWQGSLKTGAYELRIIVQIAPAEKDGWTATMYSIDQSSGPIPISALSVHGSLVRFSVEAANGLFEGKIDAEATVITGTWTQHQQSIPLELKCATPETAWPVDASPHRVQLVQVDDDVALEVLDWGGNGRPLVLLAGLGDTAHVYDTFAPKLTPAYRVCGITRRGFGKSSVPVTSGGNYSADRLGDDVIAVIDALDLNRPVLIGHSIAGQELSSIATRHPDKIAGLVYLDAAYAYALYDDSLGDLAVDSRELIDKLEQLIDRIPTADQQDTIEEMLRNLLPRLERLLRERQKELEATPTSLLALRASVTMPPAMAAVKAGQQKYTSIPSPALAIFALPHSLPPAMGLDAKEKAAFEAYDRVRTEAHARAFEAIVPNARVVRLPQGSHHVFLSHEADVLREINAFIETLPA